MPTWPVIKVLVKELATVRRLPRSPEPMAMVSADQVDAYARAGREGGTMAPMHLFLSSQICQVIQPGDRVLDLACGPANQLCHVARLNPECHFIGIDISRPMLDKATERASVSGLTNLEFIEGSITDLARFDDHSFDAVISTLALHHLPDFDALRRSFRETKRVLREGGGLYLADFGRLKRADSIAYFSNQYRHLQPEIFTRDYHDSLLAAFTREDFRQVCSDTLGDSAKIVSTWAVPFMVAVITPPRRPLPKAIRESLRLEQQKLPDFHKRDLADLVTFFALNGVSSSVFC